MKEYHQNAKALLLWLSIATGTVLTLSTFFGVTYSQENNTLIQQQDIEDMSSNSTNIILVHGGWADGTGWAKQIPALREAGHQVIAVQLPLHSLEDDVETVKRAISKLGGPTILVGHSYGGAVITNAGHNNSNVTGLVYIAAFAPGEGQSLSDFVDAAKFPKGLVVPDSGGFLYLNPELFRDNFAQDVEEAEANIMATAQKPFHGSIFTAKSGPPAWKELPTWYQVSTSDLMIPPDVQQNFAKQMNATTISVDASHASYVSHPEEITKLILDAAKG